MPVKDGDLYTLLVGSRSIRVECAVSPEAIRRGLSGREKLTGGMLFIFPDLGLHTMWMPEMKFPLDVVWLDEQLSVVHISYGLEPCVSRAKCPSYPSVYSTKYAIEVVAGEAAAYGFRIGQNLSVLL